MSDNKEIIEQWKIADMEKDFLSACLLDTHQTRKMWVDLYTHIDKTYFEDKVLGDVFLVFSKFFDKYKSMPSENRVIAVLKNLDYTEEKLNIARSVYQKDVFKSGEIEALEDDIRVFIKNNKIKNAVFKSIKLIKKGSYLEIENNIRDAIAWDSKVDLGLEMDADSVRERYARINEHFGSYIASPWSKLNEVISGGFYNKQLIMTAAASSVGKSIFLDQCAAHAWLHQDKTVVLFTMEMSDLVKSLRIDSCLTGMELKDIRSRQDDVFSYYEKIGKKNNKLIIKEYPTSTATTRDLEQYLYQLELYKGVKDVNFIVTDYSDIMAANKDYRGNKYMEDKDINESLRGMAQSLNVPVLTATQFARSATNCSLEELNEEKLSDSFWKMRTADTVIALWNTPEMREAGEIWFKLIKNRAGKKDVSWQMFVDYAKMNILD